MKIVDKSEVRTIHPDVLNDMTMEASIALLEVARDLRSGVIPRNEFYMRYFHVALNCGTAHCICGWMEVKLKKDRGEFVKLDPKNGFTQDYGAGHLHSGWPHRLVELFSSKYVGVTAVEAADAIENYLYNYAEEPWG